MKLWRKVLGFFARYFTPGLYVQYSSGSLSNAVKIHYDKKLIEHAERVVAFYQVAEKRPIPIHGGKTIDFTLVRPIALGGKITEGTTPTQKALSADKIQLTLHQLGDYVKVSDYVDETSITPLVAQAIEKFREQSGATIDKFIGHSLYSYRLCAGQKRSSLGSLLYNGACDPQTGTGNTHTNIFASGQASYDGFQVRMDKARLSGIVDVKDSAKARTALSIRSIRDAVTQLRARNIQPFADGKFVGIAHPEAIEDLRTGAGWKSWHQYTDPQAMYNGEVGMVENVRFIQSANYNKWQLTGDTLYTSSISLYATLIVGKGAYGVTEMGGLRQYVTKPNNYDSSNPLGLWSTVGWQVKMAACTLNKSAGVIVLSTQKY